MRALDTLALALLLGASLHASAQVTDEAGIGDLPCPGAVAWIRAHPEESAKAVAARDAARSLTDPALRAELDTRFKQDQDARNAWIASRMSPRLGRVVTQIDQEDVKWMYRLVTTKGFPTAAQVGERGVGEAWLLAQHMDTQPRFQAELLPALEQRHAAGELSGSDLARYTDRVLKAQGKPQRYGTQFPPKDMVKTYFGLDSADEVRRVDENRRALGVMPLADYACMMSYLRRDQL
jgi:hypothetical protein